MWPGESCPALTVRVEDGSPLTYPRWVPTTVEADRIVRHHLDDDSWQGCLDAVGRLFDDQLDIRRAPWRMHLFGPVRGIAGQHRPGHGRGHAVRARFVGRPAGVSTGRLAVRPRDAGARRGGGVPGVFALARIQRCARPSQAGQRYPCRAAAASDRAAAGAVHEYSPHWRTPPAHVGATPLPAERTDGHRHNVGRRVRCALRTSRRSGLVARWPR